MSKFIIDWIEEKTSKTGIKFAKVSLTSEGGAKETDITVFSNFPGFVDLRPEGTVEGEIKTTQNGKYINKVLNPLVSAPRWATAKPSGMVAAVKAKQEGIVKAQENRAEGVKVASTARDATLITIALVEKLPPTNPPTKEGIEELWLEWRSWLWKHWDDEQPPF